jgi:hypothetical protein
MGYNALTGLGSYSLLADVLEDVKRRTVWNKGRLCPGFDPAIWRYDDYGNPIKFEDYGNRNSAYGWEYDHYPVPRSLGGSDHESNLRPLRCSTNALLGGLLGNALNRR